MLDRCVHGPAVRAAIRTAEPLVDALDHVLRERVAELVRLYVRLLGRVTHEIRQEALDDPVLADDLLGALDPGVGEDRLLLLATLDETVRLEPLQHLAGRGAGHAEHLRDARGDGRRPGGRVVLADRESEEVDRLEVVVDRVTRHLHPFGTAAEPGRHYSLDAL